MPRDYYEVLGVRRDAGEGELKKAFRRLARELHPDVNREDPAAEERFKEAAEAYDVLSDPDRRATYDRYGHEAVRSGGYAPNFETFGSFGDIFDAFFGGEGLGGIFGGGSARPGGPAQGGDVSATAEVDLAEAATGASVEVTYSAIDRCEHCRGNGAEPGTPIETCSRCGGSGQLRAVTRTPFGQVVRAAVCDTCGGDGRIPREPCHVCHGRGRVVGEQTVAVDVPAGIADGQRIRIPGRGHAGDAGGPEGDLYVLVHVRRDERFVRDGDDLVAVVDVAAPLAALGATVEVPTLDGTTEINVPPGTQPGHELRLRGRGLPALRRGRTGDLRVMINVVVPRRLTDEQRELLERLSESLGDENLRTDEGVFSKLKRALGV